MPVLNPLGQAYGATNSVVRRRNENSPLGGDIERHRAAVGRILKASGAADSRKWPVSTGGGWAPVWARTGRDLFYQNGARQIFAAAYRVTGDSFTVQKPRLWSGTRLGDTGFLPGFDIAQDGKRVLAMLRAEDPRTSTLVRALLNVDTELRRRMAGRQPPSPAQK